MPPLVIAHRGASYDERENTIAAFERAIAVGADYVELDVRASADGALVVFHDARLERLTPLSGLVSARPAAELAEVGIPTLEQVLEVTRGRIGTMAELKGAWRSRRHDLARRTAAVLGEGDALLSFERRALLDARVLRPRLRLVQHLRPGVTARGAATYAWGVGLSDARATPRAMAGVVALGLVATVYTVNEAERMRELAGLGAGGIFTDRPDVALTALAGPVGAPQPAGR